MTTSSTASRVRHTAAIASTRCGKRSRDDHRNEQYGMRQFERVAKLPADGQPPQRRRDKLAFGADVEEPRAKTQPPRRAR